MKRRAPRWVGALLVVVAAVACGVEPEPDRIPGPSDLDDVEFDVVETIQVRDTAFAPDTVRIEAGDAVLLEVTADEPVHVVGGPGIDTGVLRPGESQVVRVDEPGQYEWRLEGTDTALTVEVGDPAG